MNKSKTSSKVTELSDSKAESESRVSSMSQVQTGRLIVMSGPSGVGKSTVLKRLLAELGDALVLAVSATTRPSRPGEEDGVDYYFLDEEDFAARRDRGEFVECCEVFGQGHWYGTLRSEVEPRLEVGTSVILEIDVDGARKVLEHYPQAVTIFLLPGEEGHLQRLEDRLRQRGTETDEVVQRRLAVARRELELAQQYKYQVVNDTVENAVRQLREILT